MIKTAKFCLTTFLAALSLFSITHSATASDIQVAVAANFTDTAKELATLFEKKTGNHLVMSFGSSGSFFSQIEQGAPYEVFLSADSERPTKLEADGYSVKGTRFVYAYGRLVLWSAKPGFVDNQGKVLKRGAFEHLAIADPASAPYGIAAVETLKNLGIYETVLPKIVKGSSIGQAYGFVDTGSAELGFIALSQVSKFSRGSIWYVPKGDYTPLDQQAVLLNPGKDDAAARAYLAFLRSAEAVKIITSYGYEVR